MRRITVVVVAWTALILAACSLTLPVSGIVDGTQETFSGTATGQLDGAGTLTLRSSSGVTCTGNFVYVTERNGEGVFQCSDGRSGPFKFVSTGSRGTGYGEIGGRRVTFTFG